MTINSLINEGYSKPKEIFSEQKPCLLCSRMVLFSDYEHDADLLNLGICPRCLAKLPFRKDFSSKCLSNSIELDPIGAFGITVPFSYEGSIAFSVRNLKFYEATYLAKFMAFFILQALYRSDFAPEVLIPVPLSQKRIKERGYNQAELICRELSKMLGILSENNLLTRVKNTKRQSEIEVPSERKENVENAFKIKTKNIDFDKSILIVDDVLTTGHTMHEAATTLYIAGYTNLHGAVLATGR